MAKKNVKIGSNSVNAEDLVAFMDKLDRLDDEISGLRSDKRDILAHAKGTGFDTKTLEKTRKLRAMDPNKRDEEMHLLETYCNAIDVFS